MSLHPEPADPVPYQYGPSRVGHGEAQCVWCLGTNRENAIISPNHCDARATQVVPKTETVEEVIEDLREPVFTSLRVPPPGDWQCRLFGVTGSMGIVLQPERGGEPNRFWRWMQFVCLGNRWEKVK